MTHRVQVTHLINSKVMTDSSSNPCDVENASVLPHLVVLISFLSFCFFLPFLWVLPLLPFPQCIFLRCVSVHPQQVWLIHILVDEQLLNAPAHGTTICGRTVALSNMIGNKILDLNNLLLLLESERSWSSLTLNKSVHL